MAPNASKCNHLTPLRFKGLRIYTTNNAKIFVTSVYTAALL